MSVEKLSFLPGAEKIVLFLPLLRFEIHIRSAAAESIAIIQEANRSALHSTHHFCSRCRRLITEDDYRLSMDRFARPYCRHCFDEVGLESRNFELKVEDAKTRRTFSGVAVQSRGEKRIGEWLEAHHLDYIYDERYRMAGDVMIRPDFYLPEFDVYIEFWGMDTPAYLQEVSVQIARQDEVSPRVERGEAG